MTELASGRTDARRASRARYMRNWRKTHSVANPTHHDPRLAVSPEPRREHYHTCRNPKCKAPYVCAHACNQDSDDPNTSICDNCFHAAAHGPVVLPQERRGRHAGRKQR